MANKFWILGFSISIGWAIIISLILNWAASYTTHDHFKSDIKGISFKKFKLYYDMAPDNWSLSQFPVYSIERDDRIDRYVIKFDIISYYQYAMFYYMVKRNKKLFCDHKNKVALNNSIAKDLLESLTKNDD